MCRLLALTLLSGLYASAQPAIDSAEYQARRRAAMEQVPDGMIALHSGSGLKHWDESGFHQDASFYAFTGLTNARNAILVLDGTEGKSWLFVQPSMPPATDFRGFDIGRVNPGTAAE